MDIKYIPSPKPSMESLQGDRVELQVKRDAKRVYYEETCRTIEPLALGH